MYQQFNSICLATIMHHTKEIKWLINFNHELYSLKTLNKYNCLQFAMYSRDILSPGVQNSGHANRSPVNRTRNSFIEKGTLTKV